MPGAAELLQQLLRFDTRNPPGNEQACLQYLEQLLWQAGCETAFRAATPERPNLIARVRGRGAAPPLLLHGHVDVVAADEPGWRHPPFAGRLVDGEIWGRGALDMKGGVAMLVAAILRARADGLEPAGDVILALMCDEETGSELGARYLVEQHAELFDGVRYALGESGGFTQHLLGRRFYPIQVAEKQACTLHVTLRGPGGHTAVPPPDTAVARLGRLLRAIERRPLPVHLTAPALLMLEGLATGLPRAARPALGALRQPRVADRILRLLGASGREAGSFLHHTVTPTAGRFGGAWNVVPGEVSLTLDGRILPGYGPADLIDDLEAILPDPVELSVLRYDAEAPGAAVPDLTLFPLLARILREADPGAIPIPMLLPGVTDARWFARLGIRSYGFLPLRLPPQITPHLIHAANERVPVAALEFGTDALVEVLRRYAAAR